MIDTIYIVWFEDTFRTYICDIFEDENMAYAKQRHNDATIPHGSSFVEARTIQRKI